MVKAYAKGLIDETETKGTTAETLTITETLNPIDGSVAYIERITFTAEVSAEFDGYDTIATYRLEVYDANTDIQLEQIASGSVGKAVTGYRPIANTTVVGEYITDQYYYKLTVDVNNGYNDGDIWQAIKNISFLLDGRRVV